MVTMGRSWARLSSVELQPDQPILSRKTSHCPIAARNRLGSSLGKNTQCSAARAPNAAIARFARNARKDRIELREIFAQRLPAPVNTGGGAQSQLSPIQNGRPSDGR